MYGLGPSPHSFRAPELGKHDLHNAGEEVEHASMVLEWIRRTEPRFDKELKEYLFSKGPIAGHEEAATGKK